MTEEQIKEQLSKGYLHLLASRAGYKSRTHELDHGVDVTIIKVREYIRSNGKKRLLDSGQSIDVQLKCTCEKSVVAGPKFIKYDLEAKSYNDLIDRADDGAPLILILMILPDDDSQWLSIRNHEIALAKCAYWYLPDDNAIYSNNGRTTRISIPRSNALNIDFIDKKFKEYYP
ncbi:DUF4365 domain-containing protein [Hymenobacter sp. PAMC 26628]|uniref:DUF4365 domain-containing protein n=1 Tax=Hymenobacter sp. PAMC 26628 TaxID=1484118 RepID=UPI0009030519|nr:DUF4365 domain-containing protein [Hymenobacter sp. PAMC 26628]